MIAVLINRLNTIWHKPANQIFLAIVLAHWAEHLVQAYQVYALGWPRAHSHGLLGHMIPWLNTSEWLHYGYAVVMIAGLILLRPGFTGRSRVWWDTALGIQAWHFTEHGLLLSQALLNITLFGSAERTSILQLIIPRVEVHLFYNAAVFIPMMIAMWFHIFPPSQSAKDICLCSARRASNNATHFSQKELPIRH